MYIATVVVFFFMFKRKNRFSIRKKCSKNL